MSIISIGIPLPDRSALPGQTGSGEEVNLQYATQNYCENPSGQPVNPTVATPAGGIFTSSDPTNFGVSGSGGVFNLGVATPGNYTVTYTVAGVGSANFPINITALDNAAFSYSATSFCKDASNQTPTITTPGGSFTTQDLGTIPHKLQFATSGVQKTITLRVSSSPRQYTIDWGDGSPVLNNYTSSAPSHTYNDGTYNNVTNPIVSINALGDVSPATAVNFAQAGSYQDLIDIVQWGTAAWTSMYRAYYACNNLGNVSATDIPNLSLGPNMERMFTSTSIGTANFNNWDISNVSVITEMFRNTPNYRGNMSNWNFVNNNNISLNFFMAASPGIYDGEAGNWNVSGVSIFDNCFRYQTNWNCNLADWHVNGFNPNLVSMYQMFRQGGISDEQYTDSIVGWAVAVKRDGAPYNVAGPSQSPASFLTSRTQNTDNNGVTVDYATKYGSLWDSNWSDAGDARQFLLNNGWSIS